MGRQSGRAVLWQLKWGTGHWRWCSGSVAVTAFALTACGTAGKAATPQMPAAAAVAAQGGTNVIAAALRPLIDTAVNDLARRLGVEPSSITVIEARSVVWPDGSLGCPRPGMVYPQVQQDGALVRLRAQGREFAYHSGGSRPVFLCETPSGGRGI